jgi:hypothetical protein
MSSESKNQRDCEAVEAAVMAALRAHLPSIDDDEGGMVTTIIIGAVGGLLRFTTAEMSQSTRAIVGPVHHTKVVTNMVRRAVDGLAEQTLEHARQAEALAGYQPMKGTA